jgi:hypothetical protein
MAEETSPSSIAQAIASSSHRSRHCGICRLCAGGFGLIALLALGGITLVNRVDLGEVLVSPFQRA